MSIFPPQILSLGKDVIAAAREKRIRIVTAESCTGGLLAACLTEIPGASAVVDRGFVTYSDTSKMAQLSVDRKTIADFGAVSAETALEMAEGALLASHAEIAVAITGVSGPGGGTADKPVGLVFIALASAKNRDDQPLLKNNFPGDRGAIRLASVEAALRALLKEIAKY